MPTLGAALAALAALGAARINLAAGVLATACLAENLALAATASAEVCIPRVVVVPGGRGGFRPRGGRRRRRRRSRR